ncbi:beta-ketoacyl-ACP synthase III [Synoicihabitans lomoniglobus]|uniref:Beta-ketoacyl-[acyl-carrier-protein] synthase III n=1 Tax=Synoicihabitans lomoniglobus TaxID=2909285 RepID=A0AAF0CSG7_9BACT|nr:ketoacyl-ACP synthase III [Opitutaceae bacterium LMO-M01]WED67176.1 ketoacyl-ACP synthase III [Opitutaceae bacterium LMO-M01]
MSDQIFAILGTGSYAPERVMTNDDIATVVETSDEWIVTRTGIKERRIAAEGEMTSDMATAAARAALADAGLAPTDIDLVIVATLTPDMPMPATACIVQAKLGVAPHAACFDVNAACSGFIYGFDTAWAMLQSGRYRHALVIGAEKLSSVLDWSDRTTCVLFGDAAGAVVMGPAPTGSTAEIIGARLYSEGGNTELLCIPGGGSNHPAPAPGDPPRHIQMKGREVFKFAVREMDDAARDILEQHGVEADEVSCVIPHQANLRIIDSIAQYLEIPVDRFYINLDRYGNTSAASIPLAIDEARRVGRVKPGDLTLLVAFGAGLTYGSALVRW